MASPAVSSRPLATPPRFSNVAELQAFLGGVPAERIRLQPFPGQATEKDVLEIRRLEGRLCELVDGILVEKPMGYYESYLAIVLTHFIQAYLDDHDLGCIGGEAGFLRLGRRRLRAPDVSFISWKSMPNRELPNEIFPSLAPDLAVEILSPSNTEKEMEIKLEEYFRAGTKLVWIVDPDTRTARVYTSPHRPRHLTENDTLEGGKVLPGFSLSIKKWFQRASRKPRK
jgi:Uma2 family endonuclease